MREGLVEGEMLRGDYNRCLDMKKLSYDEVIMS